MKRLVLRAILISGLMAAGAAQAPAQDGPKMANAIAAMKADDWPTAIRTARQVSDSAARVYAEWRRLRASQGKWSEYVAFVKTHADWPGLPLLRKKGESLIPTGRPAREIIEFFASDAPQTGTGALRLAEALISLGRVDQANAVIAATWQTVPFTAFERQEIARRFASAVKPHHWARTDHMIWEGQFSQAQAMKDYLSPGQRQLVDTRIALRRGKNGVNKMINALPASLKSNPGLAYDRFRWRLRKDLWDGAEELLRTQSTSREALGRPDIWSERRRVLARRALRDGRPRNAYDLARKHNLNPGDPGYTDLEWLAGYIALTRLNRADDAVTHFRRLRKVSVTPITQGRVWYWLGRAHEATGNMEKAAEGYEVAARYQTSFYGQLAAARAKIAPDPRLTGKPEPNWQGAAFLTSTVFRAGTLLHLADERYEGGRFFAHMAETMSEADQAKLGAYLLSIDRPNMALRVAKNAARDGRIIAGPYYPITPLARLNNRVPPELAMAIARQETELNPDATSPVGARGLMQVMPKTAQGVAKRLGLPYSKARLNTDWKYNADLGTAYLAEMLQRYNGSYVLAAAAYNAGPNRADRWISQYGDPRKASVDTIEWIENIPFRETRNYVMRVLEGVGVYRVRLTGQPVNLTIARDLARGR